MALKVGGSCTGPAACCTSTTWAPTGCFSTSGRGTPSEIRSLYEETIGPVDRYDQANGTQLTQTLTVFFKHNESLTQTAAELYAHRHTIRYRLEKIAEITGLSVFETEHKERLGLGLKARSLLTS